MREIVNLIIKIVYRIYNYSSYKGLKNYYKKLYTYWIKNEFKKVGQKCFFSSFSLLEGGKFIEIGDWTTTGEKMVLTAWKSYRYKDYNTNEFKKQEFNPTLIIGNNCIFGDYNHITCTNKIIIGDGIMTGKWVTITDNSHGSFSFSDLEIPPSQRQIISKGEIIIGKNVWIGDKVTILPGVTIGEGAVIAANSVVTKNVKSFSMVAGCPAKTIKEIELSNG